MAAKDEEIVTRCGDPQLTSKSCNNGCLIQKCEASSSMRCPRLAELPPPPEGKTGWPWTVETPPLPPTRPDGFPWPRISIVTPSYNQGQFIKETIRSIDFERTRPRIICIKAAEYSPVGAGARHADLIEFLQSKNYIEYANTNLNAIMVKREFWYATGAK